MNKPLPRPVQNLHVQP